MPLCTGDTISLVTDEIKLVRTKAKELKRAIDIQAEKELQPLFERYNSCAPISRLPDELLLAVFLLVGAVEFWPLIRISRVCRRWYAVATQSKTYWSTRSLVRRPWHPAFHGRSGNTPITALMSISSPQALSNVVNHMLQISSQLRSICIDTPKNDRCLTSAECKTLWNSFQTALIKASSSIESISLDLDPNAHIKSLMNTHSFPHLKALELSRYSFTWESSLFTSTIRRLTLTIGKQSGYKLDCLYAALRKMKRIHILELKFPVDVDQQLPRLWSTEDYTTPNDSFDAKVELEHLRKFAIEGELCLVSRIMTDIQMRPETRLDISCSFNSRQPRLLQHQPVIPPGHEYHTLLHNLTRSLDTFNAGKRNVLQTVDLRGFESTSFSSGYKESIRLIAYSRQVLPIRYAQKSTDWGLPRQFFFDSADPVFMLESEKQPLAEASSQDRIEDTEDWNFLTRFLVALNSGSDLQETSKANPRASPSIYMSWSHDIFDTVEVLHLGGIESLKDPDLLSLFNNVRILTIEGLTLLHTILPRLVGRSSQAGKCLMKPLFPNLKTLVCAESPRTAADHAFREPDTLRHDQINLHKNLSEIVIQRNGSRSDRSAKSTSGCHPILLLEEIYLTKHFQVQCVARLKCSERQKEDFVKMNRRLMEVSEKYEVRVVLDREWQQTRHVSSYREEVD